MTDSLKAYRLPTLLIFLWIGASFKHGTVVACPPCMRKELGTLALVNLLPANLLWPLLAAPWYSIAALRSMTKGHSAKATELVMLAMPQPTYDAPPPQLSDPYGGSNPMPTDPYRRG
jgi:hypothetical protein